MTEAPDKTEAKQVSRAKVLASQRAHDIDLLATVEAEPTLFKPEAAAGLKERIAAASKEFDGFSPAVRVKAMTPGQLNEMVSAALETVFKVWYPETLAAVCKKLNIEEGAIGSKDAGSHSVSITGHFNHVTRRFTKRPWLSKIVTLSRKGLK